MPVNFEFRPRKVDDPKICEPWLTVEPTSGSLITGDSLSIRLKIFIDVHNAWRMHFLQKASNNKIDLDILVLHVEDGRDIFITVKGEYRPSCFGFSVETLARLPQPVYELNLKDILQIVIIKFCLIYFYILNNYRSDFVFIFIGKKFKTKLSSNNSHLQSAEYSTRNLPIG